MGASPPHINFLYLLCQGMKCYFKFWLGFFLMMMRIYGMCSLPLLLWEEVFGLEDLLGWKTGNKAVGDICALQFSTAV